MSALKYWNGTEWVTLPDIGAKQVWTGPDAPVPIGDHRLWIDTDEPDPYSAAQNSWQAIQYGVATAGISGWQLAPIPLDASFIKNGDIGAYVRNADGSMTVRDGGWYAISGTVQVSGGVATEAKLVILQKGISLAASDPATFLCQNGCQVVQASLLPFTFVGYLPAGQIISVLTYVASGYARQVLNFEIARLGTGPAGPPGPPGPGSIIDTQRMVGQGTGYRAISGTGGQVYANAGGTIPMQINYTPPVNCWWEVHGSMGAIQSLTAAYHGGYMQMRLSPVDADGVGYTENYEVQHNQVQAIAFRTPGMLFKLAAGQAYTCAMHFYVTAGSWSHGMDPQFLSMFTKAWAR